MDVTFDEVKFFGTIEARRQAENLSWRQLGRKLGLSPSTFSRLARGRRPDVDTFLRLLAWLSVPADMFMKGTTQSPRPSEQDTIAVVAAALHADRTMPSGSAGALEQLLRVAYANLSSPVTDSRSRGLSTRSSRRKR